MRKKTDNMDIPPPNPPPIVCRLHTKKRRIGMRAYSYIFLFKTEQDAKSGKLGGGETNL